MSRSRSTVFKDIRPRSTFKMKYIESFLFGSITLLLTIPGFSKVKGKRINTLPNTDLHLHQRPLSMTLANQRILMDRIRKPRLWGTERNVTKASGVSLHDKQTMLYNISGYKVHKVIYLGRSPPYTDKIDLKRLKYSPLARGKWHHTVASRFKPRTEEKFKHLRLNDAPPGITDKLTLREMNMLEILCHEITMLFSIFQSADKTDTIHDCLAQLKRFKQICRKSNTRIASNDLRLNAPKLYMRFSRNHYSVWQKYHRLLHKIRQDDRDNSSQEKKESPVLYLIAENNDKPNQPRGLGFLHHIINGMIIISYPSQDKLWNSKDIAVNKENSPTKNKKQTASAGSLEKWRDIRQRLASFANFVYSMLSRLFYLLKQAVQKLFDQLPKPEHQRERKKLNPSNRAAHTYMVNEYKQQRLYIATNENKLRRPDLIRISYNILSSKPLHTGTLKKNGDGYFLRNHQTLYNGNEMKDMKPGMKTSLRLHPGSGESSTHQKSFLEMYKGKMDIYTRENVFEHKQLKIEQKLRPYVPLESINMKENLFGFPRKKIIHLSDRRSISGRKYFPLENHQYLWKQNGMTGNRSTPSVTKEYSFYSLDGSMLQHLKGEVKTRERRNYKAETNERKTLKSDRSKGLGFSETGRRRRRAIPRENNIRVDSKRHRLYSYKHVPPRYGIPFHRERKLKTGKQSTATAIDPIKYSWKNIKDLPNEETEALRSKLIHLMELVREESRHNQVKELDQEVESSLMTSHGEIYENNRHSKHPTLADRKILHNIELLTFYVLRKPEHPFNNKGKVLPSNGPLKSIRAKSHLPQKAKIEETGIQRPLYHFLQKRAAKSIGIQDLEDLRRHHDKAGVDLENDFLDSFIQTEVKHNTFPERWKSLKHQLNLLDEQMSKTKEKYTGIQKKIKGLITEGEVLAEKAAKNIDRSESSEAVARNTLSKLENEREKIERKIKEEEEKRDKIEEEFMRSGITGKVNNLKDELAREEYHLHGVNSMENENFDFEPPNRKYFHRKYVTNILSPIGLADEDEHDDNEFGILDSDDDMTDIEPRPELKTVHVDANGLRDDDELHKVDTILNGLLEDRVKRHSLYHKEKRNEMKQTLTPTRDQMVEDNDILHIRGSRGNSVTKNHKKVTFEVKLRAESKGEDRDYDTGYSENRSKRDLKASAIVQKAVSKKGIDRYNSTSLTGEITSNQQGTLWNKGSYDESSQGSKTKPEGMQGRVQKAKKNNVNKHNTNVILGNKEYRHSNLFNYDKSQPRNHGYGLHHGIDLSPSGYSDAIVKPQAFESGKLHRFSSGFRIVNKTRDGETHDQTVTSKMEKSEYEKQHGQKNQDKEAQKIMRKYLDLQTAMKEATNDLNSMFKRTKEAREKQWAKEDRERKEREKKESLFLDNLMKEIDTEVAWLEKIKNVEKPREKDFLLEAERDLRIRSRDEKEWKGHPVE